MSEGSNDADGAIECAPEATASRMRQTKRLAKASLGIGAGTVFRPPAPVATALRSILIFRTLSELFSDYAVVVLIIIAVTQPRFDFA